MRTINNKKNILEKVLLLLGVNPTPSVLLAARAVLIVICIIGIFYTTGRSQTAEQYGNRDEFLKEFPDAGL